MKISHFKRFNAALWISAFFIFWAVPTMAASSELVEYSHNDNTLTLKRADDITVTLKSIANGTVEVEYSKAGLTEFPPMAIAPDILAAAQQRQFTLKDSANTLIASSQGIDVHISKNPFHLAFYANGKKVVEEAAGGFFLNTLRGVQFKLEDSEKIYGGGQRVLGMDRRGQRMPLYNRASYGYTDEPVNQMYYGLPAIMSSKNYAVLFDNTASGNLDIGSDNPDVLQFDAVGGRLAYVVVAADSLVELTKQVVTVTGKQPLPPRWALGNFASRFGYRSEQETRDVVAKFNQDDIPLDAVVLDLYWFGPDIKGHMGNLQWDRQAFPTPEAMMADFAAQDVNTVVITEPFILSTSTQFDSAVNADALATRMGVGTRKFEFYFGNTGIVDVFKPQGRDWFWQYYKALAEQGVAGWWGDLGEPEVHPYDALHQWNGNTVTADEVHNAYGHRWGQMVYENSLEMMPDKRPLVLMRAGYLGSQRYGMIPWTGDVSRSWGGFKPQIELSLQMGVFGLAYTHSDLGGFAGGETFDPELYVRWLQAGAFAPVFRPHAQENIAPEPVFHDDATKQLVRRYIQLRYDMLPYNYSLAYENSLTGMPLMRPLAFIDSERFFEHKESYMWGDSLLVKPVTDPEVTSVEVDLPNGVWFDFFGQGKFDGGKVITLDAPLEKLPVLVKAGAFVPMQPGIKRTAQANSESLSVNYWADLSAPSSNYTLYEDEGTSPNAIANSQYLQIEFAATHSDSELMFAISPTGRYPSLSTNRELTWIVHGLAKSPAAVNSDTLTNWQWDEETQRLLVRMTIDHTADSKLVIKK